MILSASFIRNKNLHNFHKTNFFFFFRWYKHISEASDAFKQKTKGSIIDTNDNNGNKDLLETSQGSLNTSNPQIDPNHVLIQNDLEKNLQDETNTNNNETKKESSEEPETSDEEDEKKENENEEEEEEEQTETRVRANTNETIVLTQQCSLVEPDQVQIHLSPALVMAEPIVTLSGWFLIFFFLLIFFFVDF